MKNLSMSQPVKYLSDRHGTRPLLRRLTGRLAALGVALLLAMAAGCSTLTSTPVVTADAAQGWALLPINNLSETPQADSQALTLVETRLRAHGVQRLDTYAPMQQVALRTLLDPGARIDEAIDWARQSGYRYGITGTVSEWHYKAGADREPVVGMSLTLLDVVSGEVLWQANASRTGWGYRGLPAVADSVIAQLLDKVRLVNTRSR
ncbi:MAG: hypothetical protein HKN42_02435 [Granulosicoccus sp.]|nr:hypothetical protein [Granulosicoccus sp.]